MKPERKPDKFITPSELPSPRERELLVILMEEAAEVQHRAAKMLRFGCDEVQAGQPLSNKERLSREVGDFFTLVELCCEAGLVDMDIITDGFEQKLKKLDRYMQSTRPVTGAPHHTDARTGG